MSDAAIIVRKLPTGPVQPALQMSVQGRVLAVEWLPSNRDISFEMGDPVEIEEAGSIYLGEVQGVRPGKLIIRIEHRLERDVLEAVARVWHQPASSSTGHG